MTTPLIIWHSGCFDGYTAAWVAHRALGGGDLHPAHYGQPPPDVRGRHVYIVDFSYPRDVLMRMREEAASLLVIDHHKTAQEALSGLPFCLFDLNESGASLTWRHFHGVGADGMRADHSTPPPMPHLVAYVKDRDLWRHALPDSQAVNAWLRTHDFDLDLWDELAARLDGQQGRMDATMAGVAIRRAERKIIEQACRHPIRVTLAGVPFLATNATTLFSETAGELAQETGAGLAYFIRQDGRVQLSLRNSGKEGAPDVSKVAKEYGGGGHPGASGCDISVEHWLSIVRAETHDWLCLKCSGGSTELHCYDCGAGSTSVLAPKAAHEWLSTDFRLRWESGRDAGVREAAEAVTGALISELFAYPMEARIKAAVRRMAPK